MTKNISKNFIYLSFVLFLLHIFQNCTSARIYSPNAEKRVVLASSNSSCKTLTKTNRWYLLFGAWPWPWQSHDSDYFTQLKPGESARITESSTWSDILINGLLGWGTSLNVRTLTVEACPEGIVSTTQEQRQKFQEEAVLSYAKSEQNRVSLPTFVMTDGTSVRGEIVSFSQTEVEIRKPAPKVTPPPPPPANTESSEGASENTTTQEPDRFDVVILKSGEIVQGSVSSQDMENLTLTTSDGEREFLKKDIRRVQYGVSASELEREDEITTLQREDIAKILMPN